MEAQLLVCDLDGRPRGTAHLSGYNATASLTDAGEATFRVRAAQFLYEWLAPWAGQLVLVDSFGSVLWAGVPVKRRGAIGGGELEITAREWTHWLDRVAPLILDSSTAPYDDYGDYEGTVGVQAGFVLWDLMRRVPQAQTGFRACPLQPPASNSGALVTIGDLDLSVSRPSVWEMTQPIRDRGIDMWCRTTRVGDKFVPTMVVGNPKLGNPAPVPLLLGDNVAEASLEEDGDELVTRWRVKGSSGEAVEVFAPGAGSRILLDGSKDYADRFVDSNDEVAELTTRANRMLANTRSVARWYSDVKLASSLALEPGDTVSISSPVLDGDPRLLTSFEVTARVAELEHADDGMTLTLAEPEDDEAPISRRRDLTRVLRDMGTRIGVLRLR